MASVKLWAVCPDIKKNSKLPVVCCSSPLANTVSRGNAFASIWPKTSNSFIRHVAHIKVLHHKSSIVEGVECWAAKHTSPLLQDQVFFGQQDAKRKLTCQKYRNFLLHVELDIANTDEALMRNQGPSCKNQSPSYHEQSFITLHCIALHCIA